MTTVGTLVTCPQCGNPDALLQPTCLEHQGTGRVEYTYTIHCDACPSVLTRPATP